MKKSTTLLLLGIILLFSGKLVWAGHDYNHITFVNQTKHKVKFTVDIQDGLNRHDISKTLHSHTANYINVDQTEEHCTDDGKKRKFKIKIDIDDNNSYDHYTHRRCGEDLYIWYEGDEFHMNDEPHIKADLSGCDKDSSKPAILFAHGYNDSQKAFAHFANYAEEKGWRVFRTSVPEDGSISKRAHRLNAYINKAAKQCNIGEGKLRVAAHSMGGLDVRYIVGEKKLHSAKYFEKVYTISTPHGGDTLGCLASGGSDAARDLRPSHMKKFNKKYPYSDFEDQNIDFLALRFKCGEHGNSDGVVGFKNQKLKDAPYYPNNDGYYKARHTDSAKNCLGVANELDRDKVIKKILE